VEQNNHSQALVDPSLAGLRKQIDAIDDHISNCSTASGFGAEGG